MTDQLRRCRACGEEKPLAEFGKASKYKDGLNIRCKPCAQARRRDYKQQRLDSMTIEELEAHEEKTRQRKRQYYKRNSEKVRGWRKQSNLRTNIPKWMDEIARLTQLLEDARDPANIEAARELILTARRFNRVHLRLRDEGKPALPRDVTAARVEDLKAKLEAVSEEDKTRALENLGNPKNTHDNLPLSIRRQSAELTAQWEAERREARAKMTPEERAAERASWDAWCSVTMRELDEFEQADERQLARLHTKIEKKMAEFRGGCARWSDVQQAQEAADSADAEKATEAEQMIAYRYRQLYPQYLEEEQAKDRAAATASVLLADLPDIQ